MPALVRLSNDPHYWMVRDIHCLGCPKLSLGHDERGRSRCLTWGSEEGCPEASKPAVARSIARYRKSLGYEVVTCRHQELDLSRLLGRFKKHEV
jgi:hypothetical protein